MAGQYWNLNLSYLKIHVFFFPTVATTTVLFSLFNNLNYVDVCLSLDCKLLKGKDHVSQNATYAMLFNNYLLNANINKCRSMFNFLQAH